MAGLKLTELKKSYGAVEILHGINLEIFQGEFVVFVGPSGCGKSTLLRTIAGLESITGGTLEIGGEVVNDTKASKRGIAMVFQSYALYPHMTVYNNMAFALKIARKPKDEIDRRVKEAAEILHLTPFLDRLPKALSGGQRQRVAIGRSIVRDPKVFLFDEPLSNLDAALRVNTRIEIAKLKASMPNATMVYVTHDQVEAMTLADRIVVLNDGYIEQVGPPTELYHHPANLFVARFIGSPAMNILAANVESGGDETVVALEQGGKINLPIAVNGAGPGARVQLGVRPENLRLADSPEAGLISGTIDIVEALGEVTLLYIEVPGLQEPLIAKLTGDLKIERGTKVGLIAEADAMHLFDEAGKVFVR